MEAAATAALQQLPPVVAAVSGQERQSPEVADLTWHKTPAILELEEEPRLNRLGLLLDLGPDPIRKTNELPSFTFPDTILNLNSSTLSAITNLPPKKQMRPAKDSPSPAAKRGRPSSPARSSRLPSKLASPESADPTSSRQSRLTPAASLVEGEFTSQRNTIDLFQDLQISEDYVVSSSSPEPRSFPNSVKQQCWEKAEKVKGRDPARWRRDPLGNIVFRKLVGCAGCLCHDYDHILPYSKGGKSTLDNCQVLQATANRSKGNRIELSRAELIQRSNYCRVSGRDMDLVELLAYGNVQHTQDAGGCRIQ
ncbi:unnamed protein product [Linum trigynum]|uniref:HNH nuclease domain-containing protein n=1 Tax=Linum trigynum TaxID=586398 RepID=A0AAV2E6F1_9ROSI